MSVIVTLRLSGDPSAVEQYAQQNEDTMKSIVESAKGHGLIAHRFYGGEGAILVVDEWPDAESFQTFFQEQDAQIRPIMEAAGVTSEPEVNFWQKLDTRDEYGWDGA